MFFQIEEDPVRFWVQSLKLLCKLRDVYLLFLKVHVENGFVNIVAFEKRFYIDSVCLEVVVNVHLSEVHHDEIL